MLLQNQAVNISGDKLGMFWVVACQELIVIKYALFAHHLVSQTNF